VAQRPTTLDARQVDFLYWHAVSKTRMADFEGAAALFRLLCSACPDRTDVALGRVYCLVRQGDFEAATGILTALRRRPLRSEEMALLGRLQRRCEFERARDSSRLRGLNRAAQVADDSVVMPHTLGDDAMARQAIERR
jgi:hypothetical protein